jgi:cytochrome c-type biogenesis protein CcmH/NrfG
MSEQTKSRRQKLEEFVALHPQDAFSRYGLALACIQEGDAPAGESHFATLIKNNPDYVPGYQMYAQTLAKHHPDEARAILIQGIEAANRANNQHARSEMEALLGEL